MGNMGKMYLVQDPFLDREVAIKVVSIPSNTVIDSDESHKIYFKNFTSGELNEVLETTQWLKYDAGDTIINEGEIDDSFYIIVLGDVVVSKNSKAIAALKQGDCFGEMAYLGKTRRAADIKALCRLY